MHRVVALCFDGLIAFDLTAPAQAFALAARPNGDPLYEFSTCSVGGAAVRTTTSFSIVPQGGLDLLEGAQTIVIPGYVGILESPPAAVLVALRAARRRGVRLLSICTGAFALGYAGLLEGLRVTTHWAWAVELARRFPGAVVDAEALFVDEGETLTSAGLSAGVDISLHVIRKDFGVAVGERVARHMVAAPHRDGGQAQFVKPAGGDGGGSLEPTLAWLRERLGQPLEVAAMAHHAGVSPRTFARRFREETGTTPLQWLLEQRVLEARRMLEETDLPVEAIAWRSGFGSAASLREHFRRATATTPTAYRRSFQPPAAA